VTDGEEEGKSDNAARSGRGWCNPGDMCCAGQKESKEQVRLGRGGEGNPSEC